MESVAEAWAAWDQKCSQAVRSSLAHVGFAELLAPPAAPLARSPLVASPTPLCTAILVYLALVLGSLALRRPVAAGARKARTPLLDTAVQVHNVFLVALSSYMCGRTLYEAWRNGYTFWGNQYDAREAGMAHAIHIFYVSKLYEYFDTVIMIAKGNMRQVSLLHVYHHITISAIWRELGVRAAYYSAALNSFVHILMYTYYFLAAALKGDPDKRRRYTAWGRHLTLFQMLQFVTMLAQAVYCIVAGKYNAFLARLLAGYMLTLLALFAHFYARKHAADGANGGKRSKRTKAA